MQLRQVIHWLNISGKTTMMHAMKKRFLYFVGLALLTNLGLYYFFPTDNEIGLYSLLIFIPFAFIVIIGSMQLMRLNIFQTKWLKYCFQTVVVLVLFIMSIAFFPFPENGSPTAIYRRCKFIIENPHAVNDGDLLLNPTIIENFEKLLAARKKICKEINPDLFYTVEYSDLDTNESRFGFLFYLKNDSLFSNRADIMISRLPGGWVIEDSYNRRAIQYFLVKAANDKFSFQENTSLDEDSPGTDFYIEQNNTIIRIDNIVEQKDYFRFETYGAYQIFKMFL